MTANDVSPANCMPDEHAWQTLIELTLPGRLGSEHLAAEQVAWAMQSLNWPAAHLGRLKRTLAEAIQNVLEYSRSSDLEIWLSIRVLIAQDSEAIQPAVRPGDTPIQPLVSEEPGQQVGGSSARGWGFFLVQKQEEKSQTPQGRVCQLIELFLYQE